MGFRTTASPASARAHGACTLKVVTSASQQRGSIFAPIHWSDANASSARVGDLVSPQTDPFSGQPEAKATPVAVAPVAFAYRGFALAREPLDAAGRNLVGARRARPARPAFCSRPTTRRWRGTTARRIFFRSAVLTEYVDRQHGLYRAAAFVDGRLEGALFVGPADAPPQWGDLRQMVGGPGIAQSGPVVCACFGVGLAAIHEALASREAANVGRDRTFAARRHQMRNLPAGTEEHRGS